MCQCLQACPGAATIRCHTLVVAEGLGQPLSPHGSGGRKSEIKVPAVPWSLQGDPFYLFQLPAFTVAPGIRSLAHGHITAVSASVVHTASLCLRLYLLFP